MVTLKVNGRTVRVDDSFRTMTPEQQQQTVDEIAAQIGATPVETASAEAVESDQSKDLRADLSKLSQFGEKSDGLMRNVDSFMRGAADTLSFGTADEVSGFFDGMKGVLNPWHENFLDPKISAGIRTQRAMQDQRDDADPVASTTGRISGALLGAGGLIKAKAPFMTALPADATLGAKVAQGAKAGALYSGLYGLGSGEGLKDRVAEGVTQAGIGATLGGAFPVVASGLKSVAKPFVDAVSARINPAKYANQKIGERLSDAGLDFIQAARKIDNAPGLTLADVGGKGTRSLLRTTTNIPGKAQDFVTNKLNARQLAQGDRIKTIVRETFADPEKFEAAKSQLFKLQAETSQPLYEKALSKKNVWNNRLDMFLRDPVTQSGIKQGIRIQRMEALAENKPFNPKDYAIVDFNAAGDPIIGGVPNMRTINVIKKGLDAMLEGARHPITGRLTEEGRAIDGVRRAFLKEVDAVNPDYATARKNFANFMQINEAMEFGKEALTMSPASVKARVLDMNPMEKIAARVGAAEALRKAVDEVGWTNNAVLRLFNSRQKVQNLKALFDNDEKFAEARKMVFAEIRKRATYDAVKGNSTTARQMADMAETGGLRDTVDFASRSVTQGPIAATFQLIGSRLKMLGGLTPEVAENVARKLISSDPQTIRAIILELDRIGQMQIASDQKRQMVYKLITPAMSEEILTSRQQ